ncbi:DUF6249 domain-containing protein [Mucilaginibacter myungsuensis]|uniref:Uncharacterized protein n=1 Tax=Mucilaginibacter myungsuensis TaxID=649104 RepID=A0A929PYC2_9SPHI|nr:DUF6249 domain-containing protein [Mucilaginibacter myungsuensis]MBE9664086.1 hypothetical protein [Mucilaginibacter myungsuensis]MDN3601265.1 hypothetical protein [Mucilaginibacter myungsuensis]
MSDNNIGKFFVIGLTFAIILFFFLAWFFSHRARHRETMLMIEKGMNPNDLKSSNRWPFALRKIAVVILGFAVGSVLFWILDEMEVRSVNSDPGTLTVFAFGVGGALFLDQRYGSKKED